MTATKAADAVWAALGRVTDPCLVSAGFDLSIVDLGLVREVTIGDGGILIAITFTEPGCPFTHRVVAAIEDAVAALDLGPVTVKPLWDRAWTDAALTAEARAQFAAARSRLTRSPPEAARP